MKIVICLNIITVKARVHVSVAALSSFPAFGFLKKKYRQAGKKLFAFKKYKISNPFIKTQPEFSHISRALISLWSVIGFPYFSNGRLLKSIPQMSEDIESKWASSSKNNRG